MYARPDTGDPIQIEQVEGMSRKRYLHGCLAGRVRNIHACLLIGMVVWIMVTSAVLPVPSPSAAASPAVSQAASACTPDAVTTCPLPLNQAVSGVLASPLDLHTWSIHVLAPVAMRVALTRLPADYGMRVVAPDGTKLAERRREGTGGEVV